jgi:hypothetical protein
VLAWSLAGLIVLELVAVLVLLGLNASLVDPARMSADVVFALAVGLYAGAGLLITSRLPGNAIGWLLSLIGLTLAASMLTEQYALYGLATAPGSVPTARLAGWLSGALASLTLMLLFLVLLLFPDGRLPAAGGGRCWGRWSRSPRRTWWPFCRPGPSPAGSPMRWSRGGPAT